MLKMLLNVKKAYAELCLKTHKDTWKCFRDWDISTKNISSSLPDNLNNSESVNEYFE